MLGLGLFGEEWGLIDWFLFWAFCLFVLWRIFEKLTEPPSRTPDNDSTIYPKSHPKSEHQKRKEQGKDTAGCCVLLALVVGYYIWPGGFWGGLGLIFGVSLLFVLFNKSWRP